MGKSGGGGGGSVTWCFAFDVFILLDKYWDLVKKFVSVIINFFQQLVIGDPQMTYSPSFKVVADLQSLTYNIGATKKTLQGFAGEIINFTDKPTSYDFLADKIYQDFV